MAQLPNWMLLEVPSIQWRVRLPSVYESQVRSPTFVLQDKECHFTLYHDADCCRLVFCWRTNFGGGYGLRPFSMTVFMQLMTGETESCYRTVRRSGQEIWTSYDGETKPRFDNAKRYSITFVFILDNDSGLEIPAPPAIASGTTGTGGQLEKSTEVGRGSQKGKNEVPTKPATSENPCLKALSQDFGKLLGAESDHNVVLKCGDRTVKAHKFVLASRSEVFRSMLQSDMVEGRTGHVEVKDMDGEVFQDLVKYLYTGTLLELTEDKARKLYEAGDRYAVGSLVRRCARFLSEKLTVQNACECLALADAHSDSEFKEVVVAFVLEKKIPLMDDCWRSFSARCPLVAVEVLNRFCKLHIAA